jgi:PAS domain S-box-containing protein
LGRILDKNETVGIRAIVIDITESKRSDEALRTSELQSSLAMDLANIVYWELDPANDMLIFNDPFYALHGTTVEREGGYRMTREEYTKRFVHPDDQLRIEQVMERNITRSGPASLGDIEHRIIRRDGEVRNIIVRASIAKDASGNLIKRYGANQDITERRQMEKAVRESGEQFERLFKESPLGMVKVGADGRFIRANAAFCNMLGYTEHELASLNTSGGRRVSISPYFP